MYCLLEIVAVARDHLASQFTKQLDWLKVTIHIFYEKFIYIYNM